MTLIERINQEFIAAMKAKDAATLSTMRMLKTALKNKQIDLMREPTEEESQAVVKSQIKQLKDSVTEFEKGGREDLAAPARIEVAILEKYLPAQMDDAALEGAVKTALAEAGISSKADMGKAMGVAMKAVGGGADGARVKAIVGSLLACLVLALVASPAHAAGEAEYLLPTLRVARSFLLLLGLVAVNMVLVGGFTFMIASGRDHAHEAGMEKMGMGILATIAIAALFCICTVAIGEMG